MWLTYPPRGFNAAPTNSANFPAAYPGFCFFNPRQWPRESLVSILRSDWTLSGVRWPLAVAPCLWCCVTWSLLLAVWAFDFTLACYLDLESSCLCHVGILFLGVRFTFFCFSVPQSLCGPPYPPDQKLVLSSVFLGPLIFNIAFVRRRRSTACLLAR